MFWNNEVVFIYSRNSFLSVPFKVGSFKLKIFNWIKKEDLFSFSFFRDFVKKKQIS